MPLALILLLLTSPAATAPDASAPGWIGMDYFWSKPSKGRRVLIVQSLVPSSPAARAGLRPGDIITTINRRAVDFGDDLEFMLFLGEQRPGDVLVLGVVREGRSHTVRVKLGVMSEAARAARKKSLDIAQKRRQAARANH